MIWDFPNICDSCIYFLWVEFSYGRTCQQSESITRFVWRGHFTRVQGLPERGGYMNCLALEGFLVMKNKKQKIMGRIEIDFKFYLVNWSRIYNPMKSDGLGVKNMIQFN
jgi:hypothetical protein